MTKLIWLGCLFALGGMAIALAADAPEATDSQPIVSAQAAPTETQTRPSRPIPTMQPIPNPGEELKAYGITAAPTAATPAIPNIQPAPEAQPEMAMGGKPQPQATAVPEPPATPPPVEVPPLMASAKVIDDGGRELGLITFKQMAHGVLIAADLTGLPPGTHAFHVHTVGKCETPFLSAGGHFNPAGKMHGFGPAGQHAGDMPNIHVGPNGSVTFEVLNPMVTLEEGPNSLIDKDGSSLILHANADDYATDPSGNAGGRIACGVIVLSK